MYQQPHKCNQQNGFTPAGGNPNICVVEKKCKAHFCIFLSLGEVPVHVCKGSSQNSGLWAGQGKGQLSPAFSSCGAALPSWPKKVTFLLSSNLGIFIYVFQTWGCYFTFVHEQMGMSVVILVNLLKHWFFSISSNWGNLLSLQASFYHFIEEFPICS